MMSAVLSEATREQSRTPIGVKFFQLAPHFALFVFLIIIWEVAVATDLITSIMIPAPSAIVASIIELYFTKGTIYYHFGITFAEAVLGFTVGAAIAVILAISSALSEAFKRYIAPYAILLNVTPGIALTPVIIAWFGYGMGSKIALAAVLCFFPIYVNTLTGLIQRDEDREDLFRSLGAAEILIFTKLRLPSALPMFFAGLKIGLTTALIGAVVAEFSQATDGVGVLMNRFSFQLNMASSIATLLSMTLIGLILFYTMEFLDDRIVYWRREARRTSVSWAKRRAYKRRVN